MPRRRPVDPDTIPVDPTPSEEVHRHGWTNADILNIIHDFIEDNGFSPSIRDLCGIIGDRWKPDHRPLSTSTMFLTLEHLRRKHLIMWRPETARSIRLVPQGDQK